MLQNVGIFSIVQLLNIKIVLNVFNVYYTAIIVFITSFIEFKFQNV